MHVLGTPPAFTLSQDQTLHHELLESLSLYETFPLASSASKGIKVQKLHPRRSVSHLSTFLTLCSGTLITDNSLRSSALSSSLTATSRSVSAPLFSCSGARGCIFEGHKKPRRPERHIGTRCGTAYVPDRRYLGSSMLPLSRLVDGVTVVNASLSQRISDYTASAAERANRQRIKPAASPPGSVHPAGRRARSSADKPVAASPQAGAD